ncbi:prophage tail fiber N-terminal domain-containing protein [Enterobacter kobei]|nr:prophage tail fiber N-terminal domain-containing protein [Enterobacter kobei]
MEQILISGQYNNPVGQPLAGVRIILVSRATSNSTFAGAQVVATTDEWGKYSFNIVPGRYVASALHPDRREDYLGVMEVLPGSGPGTLNDFITALVPDDARPAILLAMQEILNETRDLASGAVARPTGEYDGDKTYNVNDLVQYAGSEYRATAQVSGVTPPLAPWELFLSRGEQGEAGAPNVLSVGRVDTLDPGKPAAAEITGDTPSQVLNLSIPRGHDGQDGKDGEPGPANVLTIGTVVSSEPGAPAAADITGDAPAQVLNLTLPRGEKGTDGKDGENGKDGDPGPANVLSIGTVETLPAGNEAVAEITGESPAQVLHLSLPAGPQGDKGEAGPANQLTVGDVTTLEPGSNATAEITGDAPAQVLSLGIPEGKAGEKGEKGEAGPANKLTIGTVTELPAGCAPAVELEGDSPEQVLNFGFPKVSGGMQIITIASGESFDPLEAEPGIYWLETGATLLNGPSSTLVSIYTCTVEVRVKTNSIRLTVTGHFNESSGYNHAGEWELMNVGAHWSWAATGPNTGLPGAGASFTVQGPSAFMSTNVRDGVDGFKLSILVGAKLYGLLNDDQDRELKEMIESEMKSLAV